MKILKRLLIIALTLIVVAGIGVAAINIYVMYTVKDNIISETEANAIDSDAIVVLGAGVRPGGTPSPMLRDRLTVGIDLFNGGLTEVMLMSGDNGTVEYNEVAAMRNYAESEGVSLQNIMLDHAGFSTYESMYRLRDVFLGERAIIVTQKYHLYRALYTGKNLGIEVYGVAADKREYRGQFRREVREVFARVKDFFFVLTDQQPTYLGDTIPLEIGIQQ